MALQYKSIPVTPLQQNCSLIWCDRTMQSIVVDPGGDVDKIITNIEQLGLKPSAIALTHGHFDHISGAPELATYFNIDILGPQSEDQFLFESLPEVCMQFGMPVIPAFEPTRWLSDKESITVGEERLYAIHTPGHTPGHLCFYSESTQLIFVGDVLFRGAIGRTDFPRGDFNTLISSIKNKLWPLGNLEFISGHGPNSTFNRERQSNPFVADEQPI